MVGLAPDKRPGTAKPGTAPSTDRGVGGVVWLDFTKGGGGRSGAIDAGEKGLPGMTVEALRDGKVASRTKTGATGAFHFAGLRGAGHTPRLPKSDFDQPFQGLP